MSRAAVTLTLVFLAVSLAGCTSKKTDDRPIDPDLGIDRRDLLKEQKRVANGEVVGELLRAPTVLVDPQGISINGYRVAGREALDSDGKLKRVDKVFDWARGLHEHWKGIHPESNFEPAANVSLPADTKFTDGASLLTTLAFAGFPSHMTVHVGDASTTLSIMVPSPPGPDAEAAPIPKPVLALWMSDGAWQEQPIAGSTDAKIDPTGQWGRHVDPLAPRPCDAATQPVLPSTVAAAVSAHCKGQCGGLVIGGTTSFHDAIAMVAAALSARGAASATVAFRTTAPCVGAEAATLPADDAGTPTLRADMVSVNGGLPTEVVTRIVRGNFRSFRVCYEDGLRKKPGLHGRVQVRFVIDRSGAVSTAEDQGSDLPDPRVVQCVVRGFRALSFPEPEGGKVVVTYPIVFSAGS